MLAHFWLNFYFLWKSVSCRPQQLLQSILYIINKILKRNYASNQFCLPLSLHHAMSYIVLLWYPERVQTHFHFELPSVVSIPSSFPGLYSRQILTVQSSLQDAILKKFISWNLDAKSVSNLIKIEIGFAVYCFFTVILPFEIEQSCEFLAG